MVWLMVAVAMAAEPVGHCSATETVQFSCEASGGKHISLCAGEDGKTLQYRFGKPGAVELSAPEDSALTAFEGGHTTWARGEEYSVAFEREGHVYKVVHAIGSGIDGPANNYAGVKVLKGEEELAFVQCTGEVTEQLASLQEKLPGA